MELARMPIVREWLSSWVLLARNKAATFASCLVDAVFFVAFGILSTPILDKLTEHVIIIGTLLSEQMRVAAGRARPAVIDVLFQQPVRQYSWQLIGLLALLIATVFVLFCVLQGLNWWIASSIAGKKRHWRDALVQFCRVNLLWFGLYIAWYVLDTLMGLRSIAVRAATGQPAGAAAPVLGFIVLAVIVYFALVSYSLLRIREAISIGARRTAALAPAFLLVAAHFLAGNWLVRGIGAVNATAQFIVGVLLLLPLLAWARVYVVRMVQGCG